MLKASLYEKSWYNERVWEKNGKNQYMTGNRHKTKNTQSRRKSEQIKLDQIMRVLFKLSKRVTIHLLNSLFGEHFIATRVKVIYENSDFVDDDFGRITGDLFIRVEQRSRVYRYHIEFQTLNDESMVLRMFRYGFDHAIERISDSKLPEKEKRQLVTKEFARLVERIQQLIHILREIHDEQAINTGDLERILEVIQNITEYLYKRYGEYKNIEEEVHHMIKTLYDPEVERRGLEKGMQKGWQKGWQKEK